MARTAAKVASGGKQAKSSAKGAGLPSDLSKRGKRIWAAVEAYLKREELHRDVQYELIELYVRAVDRAIEMRKISDKEPTVEGSQGQPVANPVTKIAQEAAVEAHRWAESLLITPAAIQRHLKAEDEDGSDEDDLGF